MGTGPAACGTWRNLLEALGLNVPASKQNGACVSKAQSFLTGGPGNTPEQVLENSGSISELQLNQRGKIVPRRAKVELRGSRATTGADPAKGPARASRASAGHPGKAMPMEDAVTLASANVPFTGTELTAASSSPGAVASPVSLHPHTASTEPVAPGKQDPLSIPGIGVRDTERAASPKENGASHQSTATGPGAKIPTPQVESSDANATGETIAPEDVLAGGEEDSHRRLASPVLIAPQARESRVDSPPVEAADSVSLAEKQAPLQIPPQPHDTPERSTVRSASLIAGRAWNPVKDQGAKLATHNMAGDPSRHEGPSFANEAIFLNPPLLREPGPLAGMAEKHGSTPQDIVPANSDPFNALDAAHFAPHAWIRAGAHQAEAGYLDPALGWVSVRAEAATNGVHAALVPASGEAAQVLGSHLAGLNAYLSEHQREPATVTMSAPQDGRDGSGIGPGDHAGQGDSARQESAHNRQALNEKASVWSARVSQHPPVATSEATSVPALAQGGKYISVVA